MVKVVGTKEEFHAVLASAGDKAVIVDFYADWCGPCKQISPYMEELAGEYPGVIFIKINVDENEETSAEAGIQAMPTFQVYKNKAKVGELVGASREKLKALVEKHKD